MRLIPGVPVSGSVKASAANPAPASSARASARASSVASATGSGFFGICNTCEVARLTGGRRGRFAGTGQSLQVTDVGRKPRHGFRARPPRLDIPCKASVRVGKTYYGVDVHDISLGGMKVEPIEEYCVGKKVVVVVESLRPVKGEVRWFADRRAGIVFDRPLEFEELSEWVGKRLELASLKATFKN